MNDIKNYYANKFNIMTAQLNPKETEALNKLSQKYSFEELSKAIDSLSYRPKPTQLESTLIELLSKKTQEQKQKGETSDVKRETSEHKTLTFDDIPYIYKRIFTQYNIPKNLIDFNLLSSLDKYLKTVYLSDLIAEHLYERLTSDVERETLEKYTKIANRHFAKMTLSQREKEEAYKIYIKSLIKKELGIYT
jgi:DNA-binding CsgD family transcriptional regulator